VIFADEDTEKSVLLQKSTIRLQADKKNAMLTKM
jgi:hypothetical protein